MSFISMTLVLPHLGQRIVQRISPESLTILTGRAFPHMGHVSFAARSDIVSFIPPEIYQSIPNIVQ